MRVALACPYAWDAPGGVQTHVRQLAAHLRALGDEVLVVTPANEPPGEPWVVAVGRPVRIPFNQSIAPIAPAPWSLRRVREALAAFGPNVVHAHEPLVPGTGMFAALSTAAPVVATFHAYADRSALLRTSAPVLRRVWNRLALRIAVSDAARSFVARVFGGEVRVIPNGADVGLFRDAEPRQDLPPGRRVLFVNRLDRRKGFRVAVEALPRVLARVPDALLVVAGDGEERSAAAALHPEARGRLHLLGTVAHDKLPPVHAACEVFVGPATGRESFGIVLIEALAAGLPVVASDIPGYREVVRAGIDGILVPPGDPEALAAAVVEVLLSPDLAKRLAEAGRGRAERYDWARVAGEIRACYAEAVGTG